MNHKIIGIGNTFRHDDGVGVLIARRLATSNLEGVMIEEASGEGADLMRRWENASAVVLIDATRSNATPGTIRIIDAAAEEIPSSFFSYSTHAFSIAEAVEMARALDQLPPKIRLFGIEGEDFSTGEGLSSSVESAAESVVRSVISYTQTQG